ncbi:vWA domain-containing protein [Streptomyces kanamyceticus]|uniref:VWA domain-containing protein n=1 Tax=Streptomyces kanamyceticus TaxID=1967 RepID=A0A5J6GGW6_STRKN|nr:VWA domain-containing protein [Streptomyces kanamyceticus]QEU94267.1 VWA domain-containing protein [Streptomyces kanamyceticus]
MRTRKIRHGLLAAALAGGLLLTGCSGGSGDNQATADDKSRGGGTAPLPAPAAPESGGGTPDEGEQQDRDKGEFAPAPDYLSTFALDVDTASYGFARRTLAEGRLPDPATVRPEEFVNSFRQDYRRPDGDGFSVSVDGARIGENGWSLVRVGLATRGADEESERPPAALTFVIDVSGSMAEPGRLDLVKKSLGIMTDQLRPDDSIALVTFSDTAETVLPMTRLGDTGGSRSRVHSAVDRLEPTQSTNLEAGITTGYDTAVRGKEKGATNRVVLLSDALANTGETSADAILERISDARREHGITLFGVGVGSDYGDALMERLADKGDGHTAYVSDVEDAREVFCEQLPAHVELRARDAKAQVAFDPETVERFRLIGYDNRRVADEDFRDDSVDGGEIGPGHTVTALYAVRAKPGADGHLATASVRWLDPESRAPHEESGRIEAADLEESLWRADGGLQVSAIAAYFADGLRFGAENYPRPRGVRPLPGTPSLEELTQRAHELPGDTAEREPVRELTTAIEQAARLEGREL